MHHLREVSCILYSSIQDMIEIFRLASSLKMTMLLERIMKR